MSVRGFTLVELVVVLAILAGLMGMTALATRGDQREAAVRAAAEELAATLRTTRHRALATRQCHAVAFHLQNAPGSSGAVLNNRSGGHWYRVLGPAKRTRFNEGVRNQVPWSGAKVQRNRDVNQWSIGNFPDFVADVADGWIGDPRVLPAGRVRFLALGDTDEGPRRRPNMLAAYSVGGETTYPRPWFGYFEAAAGRLWPWGGYDPARNTSGFCYEGADGDIAGSANPADRLVDHDWDAIDYLPSGAEDKNNGAVVIADRDRNGDGDTDDAYEREVGWPLWRRGEPRPLVNAAWLDACLVFLPDGSCTFGEWNRARRFYAATVPPAQRSDLYFSGKSGIPDRAMPKSGGSGVFTDPNYPSSDQLGEVAHFDRHTGGWHLTLAPDSPDDRDRFPDAAAALESILPAWRVHVSGFGAVRAFRVQRRPGWLDSLPASGPGSAWPKTPDAWLESATSGQVNRRCRLGFLHRDTTGSRLEPSGEPITEIIDPAMLTRRVWWRE